MSAPTESTPPPHVPVPPHAPVRVPLPPPPGTAFSLGWLMAGLFDDRRRRILDVRQPPFSQAVQLPLVADLDDADLLKFLVTDLHDLLRPYHDVSDARVQAEAAKRQPGSAEPFDNAVFDREVNALHLAILDRLADDQQTWLNGAGTAIPQSTGAIVGQSLGHWADWIDINAATLRAAGAGTAQATTVISALRVQGAVWHSVLTADPDVSLNPAMGAWVQAGSAMARAVRMVTGVILRRFWPVVVIALAALAGLLYLVIANLSGAGQVWGSLVTVIAVVGAAGGGIFGGVSRALGGVGYDIWNAARREAQVWSITWLPAITQGARQRATLESRGVAAPNIRKNLEG